jgi:hypothetical protein
MCDVHVIVALESIVPGGLRRCSVCQTAVTGLGVEVHGHLDDGSGPVRFIYHDECYEGIEYDENDDGCFSYGVPL